MQEFEEFLRRHSRKNLSLERKNSHQKMSEGKLRRRSQGRSSKVKFEMTLDHHNRSQHHNIPSTSLLKKDVSGVFLRGKSLYKQYRLEEACKQFERVLLVEPNNAEALYLNGISHLNLSRAEDSVRCLERLQQSHPHYKSNLYLLLAIGHNKLRNSEKALQYLSAAVGKYEKFLEAYCYRAKIYLGLRKHQKAEEDFDAAIAIDPTKQVALVGKADCLRMRGDTAGAVKYYSLALQQSFSSIILLKRAMLYYENSQHQEALQDINELLRIEPITEAFYYRGMLALDFENNEPAAVLYFQQAIKQATNVGIASKSAQQLLKLKIDVCDFYECTSILQWAAFNNVEGLDVWAHFVDGVVSLMKKKPQEGQTSLTSALTLLEKNKAAVDHDYLYPLARLYHAYSLFYLQRYEAAFNDYQEYERFVETVLGKEVEDHRIRYNKLLCEGLMLCEGEFYEESLEKLRELIEMEPTKIQSYFYQCMVLLKVAFSDMPCTHEFESREEIFLGVLEIIEEKVHIQNNASVMFYDGVLKAYFSLYQESEKSFSKAIEKGEEHLAKYFYWRAVVNSLMSNNEQALADISVSINIEEKPEYIITRCRLYQLQKKTEEAYEDLQKYIEMEPNQLQVSKWATIILFMNKAYEEAERALTKIPYIEDQPELKLVVSYLRLMAGKFSEGGPEGQIIEKSLGNSAGFNGLDHLIGNKEKYGYLSNTYLYFLRVARNYINGKYSAAIKDLQYLMFISKDDEIFLEVKYNIMVCHLLNGDQQKATSLFKGMHELEQRLSDIQDALQSNQEKIFDDLTDYSSKRRLSEYIEAKTVPGTKVSLKLSIPFPEFPDPKIELKLTEAMIQRQVTLEAVEGKGEAPWIRRTNPTSTVQFTSHIENFDVSLRTSQGQSRAASQLQ